MELLWVERRREEEGWRERQSGEEVGGDRREEEGQNKDIWSKGRKDGRKAGRKEGQARRALSGCLHVLERQMNANWNTFEIKLKTKKEKQPI